jgi:hypothetical protein
MHQPASIIGAKAGAAANQMDDESLLSCTGRKSISDRPQTGLRTMNFATWNDAALSLTGLFPRIRRERRRFEGPRADAARMRRTGF